MPVEMEFRLRPELRLALPRALPTSGWLSFFFFNDTATTEIYTLSLHDALPIGRNSGGRIVSVVADLLVADDAEPLPPAIDRKSTRLNSSHVRTSYAVFCLKKKKNTNSKYHYKKKKKNNK